MKSSCSHICSVHSFIHVLFVFKVINFCHMVLTPCVSFSVVMENTYQVFNIIVHAFYKLLKFFHCAFTVTDNRSFDLYEAKSEKTKILYKGRFFSRVPLVEQELLNLPEHLSSAPVFSEVCVTRS